MTNPAKPAAISAANVTVEYVIPEYRISTFKEFVLKSLQGGRKRRLFKAVDGASLEVGRGESVAIMGHNGSGKSTFLKVLAGIINPPGARVDIRGRIAPMIELGAGFDGELSGYENIRLSCLLMGLSDREVEERMAQIIHFAELEEFIDMPLKNYSSGMYARLGFACATAVDPDVLLVDEVLAVGDANFAKKCLARIERLRQQGTSVVIVSHDDGVIRKFCDRGVVMSQGKMLFDGPIDEAIEEHHMVMDQRYLDHLKPEEREEALRQKQLEADWQRSHGGRDNDPRPVVSSEASLHQGGQTTKSVDFSKPFSFRFNLAIDHIERFKGNPYFGIEVKTASGQRIGGCGTHPQVILNVGERKGLLNIQVEFPFDHGLPEVCGGKYTLVLGVHDFDLRRTVHIQEELTFTSENTELGANYDGDIVTFAKHVGDPRCHNLS